MQFRNRQIITVSVIFVAFAMLSLLVGAVSERNYKRATLSSKLEAFCDVLASSENDANIIAALPPEMRVTLIARDGAVLYDSRHNAGQMENHLHRPEVVSALKNGKGHAIRESDTASPERYFYLAKAYDDMIIRCAQTYEAKGDMRLGNDNMLLLSLFFLVIIALLVIVRVSEKYSRAEQQAADSERRRLKHELTGNISHELKTPVSSIQGYLETIVNHPEMDEEKRQLFIERSYLQALRLTNLITDISLITKLEEVPEQFKIEPVNIKQVFCEVCDEMSEGLEAAGISTTNRLPPICIRSNYTLVYAIFRNLVENTVKYAGGPCRIDMRYSTGPHGLHCFDYTDSGKGVSDDELERIFDRFYRVSADRNNPQGGSGLGLSIIKNAVLFHHGTIRSYRVEGGGLGFHFTLQDLR